eukprot:Awhi_evm1s15363
MDKKELRLGSWNSGCDIVGLQEFSGFAENRQLLIERLNLKETDPHVIWKMEATWAYDDPKYIEWQGFVYKANIICVHHSIQYLEEKNVRGNIVTGVNNDSYDVGSNDQQCDLNTIAGTGSANGDCNNFQFKRKPSFISFNFVSKTKSSDLKGKELIDQFRCISLAESSKKTEKKQQNANINSSNNIKENAYLTKNLIDHKQEKQSSEGINSSNSSNNNHNNNYNNNHNNYNNKKKNDNDDIIINTTLENNSNSGQINNNANDYTVETQSNFAFLLCNFHLKCYDKRGVQTKEEAKNIGSSVLPRFEQLLGQIQSKKVIFIGDFNLCSLGNILNKNPKPNIDTWDGLINKGFRPCIDFSTNVFASNEKYFDNIWIHQDQDLHKFSTPSASSLSNVENSSIPTLYNHDNDSNNNSSSSNSDFNHNNNENDHYNRKNYDPISNDDKVKGHNHHSQGVFDISSTVDEDTLDFISEMSLDKSRRELRKRYSDHNL